MFVWLTTVAALLLPSRPATAPNCRAVGQRAAVPFASASAPVALTRVPDDAGQLVELVRELASAAKTIGNEELAAKLNDGRNRPLHPTQSCGSQRVHNVAFMFLV